MNAKTATFVTLNIVLLGIITTLLGAFVSFVFYYIFDEYNEEWEKKTVLYQLTDVSIQVALLAVISFWSSQYIEYLPPIFPVSKYLDEKVDQYITGIFFIFAVFVFMDELSDKLRFIFNENLSHYFDSLFPDSGSIISLNLSYKKRKTKNTTNLS